jgi:hypothetical protein
MTTFNFKDSPREWAAKQLYKKIQNKYIVGVGDNGKNLIVYVNNESPDLSDYSHIPLEYDGFKVDVKIVGKVGPASQ